MRQAPQREENFSGGQAAERLCLVLTLQPVVISQR